ncbi:hypothetical protein SBA5_450059 [Candidatus Sulfotelmatomonas gaucii]|uniref:Uncharacterized protein n=1 Tax=Candidatus Sulfuritelmatomonas gaucii TaxID=2043161 RepID=A0A2N9LMF7_9BACT|nr:hypothetical protein SBA5_450059 [Candidatus Sulfotelmatomonas gaucii]
MMACSPHLLFVLLRRWERCTPCLIAFLILAIIPGTGLPFSVRRCLCFPLFFLPLPQAPPPARRNHPIS